MSDSTGFIQGFDPGGKGNFGWSVCREVDGKLQPPTKTGLADDAWDARNRVKDTIACLDPQGNSAVLAAGIDAPLFWSKRGNRRADGTLRGALRNAQFPPRKLGGVVQAVNALRGACLVQGMLLARYLHETWPLSITEAHPKALRHLLCHSGKAEEVRRLTAGLVTHKRDATLCAVAAWAMRHHHDLYGWQDLFAQEPCPVQPFDIPVGYWMPIPPASTAS